MIQQSPSERALPVLISRDAAIQACQDARSHAERHYGVAEGVGADMDKRRIEALASQAAQPAEADGAQEFKNRVVRLLNQMYNECTHNDTEAFAYERAEKEVRALRLAATPKAPAIDAGGLSACNKCGAQYPSAPADAVHKCGQCSGMCYPLATPPAPNDDLRAENERLRARLSALAFAAYDYAGNYLLDERDEPELCAMFPNQHERIVRLFETIEDADALLAALKENRRG